MPNKHAALKQIRKDHRRREQNHALRSELKTLSKRFLGLLSTQKVDEAKSLLPLLAKHYDHAASKGIIHRNTAARYKSRLTRRVNSSSAK